MTRLVLASAVFCSTVFGQQALIFTNQSSRTTPDGTRTVTFSGLRGAPQVVIGAPYSAEQVSENTQTLADGTHIRNEGRTVHLARDTQGRTRLERPLVGGPNEPAGTVPTIVQIYDPVAGVGYVLDEQNKVAHRLTIEKAARPMRAPVSSRPAQSANQPERSHEDLGSQTIEGVTAEGTRTTTTWPIGSQGNDRPLVDTYESWHSAQLRMDVLFKSSSLRGGDSVTRLINISTAEPDPSLFQPPADYTIVDDKDTVTLTLKAQQP